MSAALMKLIFWEFRRTSWQYDVVVAIILAFIFLTPRDVFRDQPRSASVVMVGKDNDQHIFWIDPDLLEGTKDSELQARAGALLKDKTPRKDRLTKLTPIFDSDKELKGYLAYTQP